MFSNVSMCMFKCKFYSVEKGGIIFEQSLLCSCETVHSVKFDYSLSGAVIEEWKVNREMSDFQMSVKDVYNVVRSK